MRPAGDDGAARRGYRPPVSEPGGRAQIRRSDIALAVVVAAIQLGASAGRPGQHPAEPLRGCLWGPCVPTRLDGWGYLLLALGPAALLVRRAHPRGVLAFAFVVTAAYVSAGFRVGPVFLSLAIAFVTAVRGGDRWAGWVAVLAGWAVFSWLPAALGSGPAPSAPQALGLAAWLLAIMFAAEVLRGRRDRIAAQRRSREAEGLRREQAERLRIARELHDVLAHNISLINVQSGVALHLLQERPEQAKTALSIINDASAEALREMRSVLGVLRGVDEQAPRAPAAGLDRLEDLVASAAAAGVSVQTDTAGRSRPLATPVDLAAYRIVQESLTNVARHAGGGRARVSLDYGPDALAIDVVDNGCSAADGGAARNGAGPGTGNGIVGMRERAVALGGALEAGPRSDGAGFRVHARLPYGSP